MIAVGIKTFLRDKSLLRLLDSVENSLPENRIYIADDGRSSLKKTFVFDNLIKNGHKVITLPFDSGISKGRSEILKNVKEDFYLNLDDDFEITEKLPIQELIDILNREPNLAFISGTTLNMRDWKGKLLDKPAINQLCLDFEIKDRILRQIVPDKGFKQYGKIKYKYADFTSFFFLGKTKAIREIGWGDYNVGIVHPDFSLRVKQSKWQGAFTPDFKISHHMDKMDEEYMNYRLRYDINKLLDKWKLKDAFYPDGKSWKDLR